jgi:creatinine amidohydrolase
MKTWASNVAAALGAIKADNVSLRLQDEFFEAARQPLNTKQP